MALTCSCRPQGLDPASRRNLWDVVKAGRAGRGIILTTHSMEEAEVLCDRLGIFVDGRLVCIGAPKEIASRYGKYLVRCTPAELKVAHPRYSHEQHSGLVQGGVTARVLQVSSIPLTCMRFGQGASAICHRGVLMLYRC